MDAWKQLAVDAVDKNEALFTDVSDKIWEYAELSLKEFRSAQLYCKVLEENGFTVEKNLGGMETAFCGSFGSGRPVIGILGEFDALSGLSQAANSAAKQEIVKNGCGHGCGHNMLGAGSFAAAFAVKEYLQQSGQPGTVVFYGCPGEEGGASKAFLARDRYWDKLDAALSWHPGDANETMTGSSNACIQVLYKFKGVSSHAAGDPESGRSALDAVELMNVGVQFLREHMTDDARIHYAITDAGGLSPNVVQPKASVLYMVRSSKVKNAVELAKRVDKIADGAALMTETTYEKVFIDGTANTVTNFTLEKVLQSNMELIGAPHYTKEEWALADAIKATYPMGNQLPGKGTNCSEEIAAFVKEKTDNFSRSLNDFIMPAFSSDICSPGSTDVADVSWQTPTGQVNTVTFTSGAPGHSWQNVSTGGGSIGHKGLLYAGKILACSAIDLFTQPELLEKAREEFKRRTAEGYTCPIPEDAVPIAIEE